MAALVFDIDVEYQKVTQLTKELKSLEAELEKVSQTGTPEEMEAITSRMAACRAELKQTTLAAAQLGVQVQQGIGQRMAEATADVAGFSASVDKASTGVASLDFGTAQERVNALSMAIYDNEKKLASNVVTLNQYRQQARQAFESGDAEGLKSVEQQMQSTIQTTLTLTSDTRQLKDALQEALNVQGSGVSTADAPKLFSEEDLAAVDAYQQKIQDLKAEIATVGQQGGDTSALTQELMQTEDALNAVNVKAAETASALGTDLGGRASEAQQALIAANQAVAEQEEALATLETQVEAARQVVEDLSNSETANEQEAQQAIATYEQLSQTLAQGQVALQGMQARQQAARQTMQSVSQEIATHDNALVKMLGGYQNYQKILGMLPGPIKSVITGIQGITKASWSFLATPTGAVIGALVLALTALWKWFNKSAEGQRAFAKITGVVSGVLNKLNDIVMAVGKAIYNAFTNPKQAVRDLWQTIKSQIVNRVKGIGGMFTSLGKIIEDALHGNWDEAKKGFKDLADSYMQSVTGVEDAAGKMKKALKDITDTGDIKQAMWDLENEYKKTEAERNRISGRMQEARMAGMDTSKSAEERRKAIEEYESLNKQLTDMEVGYAQRRYDLQKKLNSLSTNSQEDYEKEYGAEAALEAAKNAQKQREQSVVRLRNSINRSGKTLANASVKAVETEANARQKAQETAASTLLQLREDNEKAELDLMEEGTEKRLAQIEYEYGQTIEKIQEQARKLAEANKTAGVTDVNEYGLTEAQQAAIIESEKAAAEKRRQAQAETYAEERKDMQEFLKEYGDYEQKRLAITEEYEDKIRKAQTAGQAASLRAEMDKALKGLNDEIGKGVDWEALFTNLRHYTVDYLRKLQAQVKEMLSDDSLTAEQAAALGQRLSEINAQILESGSRSFTGMTDAQRTLAELEQQLADAQERQAQSLERHNALTGQCEDIKGQIEQQLADEGIDIDVAVNLENADEIMRQMERQGASDEAKQKVKGQLGSLGGKTAEQSEWRKELDKNTTAVEASTEAVKGATEKLKKDQRMDKVDKAIDGLNDLSDIADKLNLPDWTGQAASNGAQALSKGKDAYNNFMSGNYFGALTSGVSAIGSLFSGLFGGKDSDKHYERDMERLSQTNEALQSAIEKLTDKMTDYTTSLTDATAEYNTQAGNLESMEKNTQEELRRSGEAYKSGGWFSKGVASSNSAINSAVSASEWAKVFEAAGVSLPTATKKGFRTVTDYASAFWELTSEQMYKVSTEASDLYSKIKAAADDGYRDAAQYMDEYCEYYEQLIELQNEYAEKLTGTSFDSLCDSFKSAIMDMSHSAEDFANDFEELMKEAVVSSVMSATYSQKLQDWYDEFRDSMESGGSLSRQEQEDLRQEYMDIVDQAQSEIKALYGTMGWDTSASSQEAKGTAFTAMSEDTGEELNGRFTAMYESLLRLELIGADATGGLSLLTDGLDTLTARAASLYSVADDARDIIANSYLELQQIEENTGNSASYLRSMRDDLYQVRQNTSRL
ncbi:MAG: hypothetical protein LUC33_00310 [Prevotellaceae bacterium]|nr:hypothetical protein [Prevotellaceae bacterium]